MAQYRDAFLENVKVAFTNFEGVEKKFNPAGNRNFLIILDTQTAMDLQNDGWPIRTLKPREEGDEPGYAIRVIVNYRYDDAGRLISPTIWQITDHGHTLLNESTVGRLDRAEIKYVDAKVNYVHFDTNRFNDKPVDRIYLERMSVYVQEDQFEAKYYDLINDMDEGLPFKD